MQEQPSHPPNDRFKAEMPKIPGVAEPPLRPSRSGGPILVIAGLIAVLVAVFVGGKLMSKPRKPEPPPPAAQIELPAATPDLSAALPVATEQNPTVAHVGDLAKPWDS